MDRRLRNAGKVAPIPPRCVIPRDPGALWQNHRPAARLIAAWFLVVKGGERGQLVTGSNYGRLADRLGGLDGISRCGRRRRRQLTARPRSILVHPRVVERTDHLTNRGRAGETRPAAAFCIRPTRCVESFWVRSRSISPISAGLCFLHVGDGN